MTKTYSFYGVDGRVLAQQYIGPADQLPALLRALPAGAQPIVGALQPERHRVELVVDDFGDGVPVARDYVPAAPDPDAWRTWTWDADGWAWRQVPTLAARRREALAAVDARIVAIEAGQERPQREVLLAAALGQQPPEAAVQRLQEIEAAVVPLRAARAAVEAATTDAELAAAVPNSP